MARWIIVRQSRGRDGTRLVYQNMITSRSYDLGGVDSTVPDEMVIEWVFNHAENLTPGDFIHLSDGKVLQYSRSRGLS